MLYRQHGALGDSIEHFYMKHAVVSLTRLACRCTIWHKCIDAGGVLSEKLCTCHSQKVFSLQYIHSTWKRTRESLLTDKHCVRPKPMETDWP